MKTVSLLGEVIPKDSTIGNPKQTIGDKSEEGEDDIKSSCPLCPGRYMCYNGQDKGLQSHEGELTPKTYPQFRF